MAHSIREIEKIILRKYGFHYHIFLYTGEREGPFKVYFNEKGCEIRIHKKELSSAMDVRLRLAHEIGHLIYNIDLLPDSSSLNSRGMASQKEEFFAWRFAYELIKKKSGHYHDELYKEYEIQDLKLKELVLALTENKQSLNAELKNYLNQKPATN